MNKEKLFFPNIYKILSQVQLNILNHKIGTNHSQMVLFSLIES